MSGDGGNDNVFARWSRRKLSARLENPAPGDDDPSPDLDAEDPGAAEQEPEATRTETEEPEEPLPRIEDLTAESDLSAFLRKGVPLALKSAAMRKMWSLDPGIRDYVGPSEYAWDFNQPGSMGGFGPIEAKETVVDFLSKTARAIETDSEETATIPEPSATQPPADAPAEPPDAVADPDPEEVSPGVEPPLPSAPIVGPDRDVVAVENRASRSSPQDDFSRPRHGGAMPR